MEAATRAGKAVLCEKPVDLSLERARACQNVVDATGRPVMDPSHTTRRGTQDSPERQFRGT